MSRALRLALAGAFAVSAIAPLAPAHAVVCSQQTVCDQYDAVCARLSTHDFLHSLVCYIR